MPQVVVGALVALGAATVVSTAVAIGIGIVTAIALPALIKSLTPNLGDSNKANQELGVGKPKSRIVVGEHVVSGDIIKYEKREHDGKEWHHMFIPLCSHASESVELYQLDGKQGLPMQGSGYRIESRLGDQTQALPRAKLMMSDVDDNFIGYGYTDVYCEFAIDPEIFPNGLQDLKFKVRGIRVYDPRKDSTAGGAGVHRVDDPSTWEWTQNAALINFWWKRFYSEALELPIDMFSMDNVAEEANICDELVDDGNGGNHARYTCDGVIDLSQGTESVEDNLLSSCGGAWVEANGGFELKVAAWRGPETLTINDQDLVGPVSELPHLEFRDRVNTLDCNYVSADHFYQATDTPPVVSDFLKNGRDNNVELNTDFPLAFTTNGIRAQRLAVIQIEELALGQTLSLPLGKKTLLCKPHEVVRVNLNAVGNKLFQVIKTTYDWAEGTGTVELKETAPEIYNSSITPLSYDPAPNVVVDNTQIAAVTNIAFTPMPNDAHRAGVLTWEHPVPTSVVEYIVSVYSGTDTDLQFTYRPQSNTVNVPVLPPGDYTVYITAKNIFTLQSTTEPYAFSITEHETPATGSEGGDFLFFEPNAPAIPLPYHFEFFYAEADFGQPPNNGYKTRSGKALDVISAIKPGTVYTVWYRMIIKNQPGTWQTRQVQSGNGLTREQLDSGFNQLIKRIEPHADIDLSIRGAGSELITTNVIQIASSLKQSIASSTSQAKDKYALFEIQEELASLKLEAGLVSPYEFNAAVLRLDGAEAEIESLVLTRIEQDNKNIEYSSAILQHSDEILALQETIGDGDFTQLGLRLDAIENRASTSALAIHSNNIQNIVNIASNLKTAIQQATKLAIARSEIAANAEEQKSTAEKLDLLEARHNDAESKIVTLQQIEAADDEAVAESVLQVITQMQDVNSQITQLINAFVSDDSSLSQVVTQLDGKVDLPSGETLSGKITEQLDLNIGYCSIQYDSAGNRITSKGQCQAAGGQWISGTLAQILDSISIKDSAGNAVSLTQALQAITDADGNLVAAGSWLINANGQLTGIKQTRSIGGQSHDISIVDIITDIFRITSKLNGQAMFEADTTTGFLTTRFHQVYLPDGTGLAAESDFRMPIIELEYLDGNTFTQKPDMTYDAYNRRVAIRAYLGGIIIDTSIITFAVNDAGELSYIHAPSHLDNITVTDFTQSGDVDKLVLSAYYHGAYNDVYRSSSAQRITVNVIRKQFISSGVRISSIVQNPANWVLLAEFDVSESPVFREFRLEPFTVLFPGANLQTMVYRIEAIIEPSVVGWTSFTAVANGEDYKMTTPIFISATANYPYKFRVSVMGTGVVPAGTEIRLTQVLENSFPAVALN